MQRPATAHQIVGDWDHSQSYLASSWAAAGGALRETAITSMGGVHEDEEIRNHMSSRFLGRRSSDGEAWANAAVVTRSPSSTREKRHAMRKHRKSRSWHPSPYVSEEEDEEEEDSLSREEKKARIKAEIARRRQQIQQRAGLHGELIGTPRVPGGGTEHERHSVLKSVDQLLRDQYGRYDSSSGIYGRATSAMYHGTIPGGYASSSSRPTHHHHHHHHHHLQQAHLLSRMTPGGHIISPSASEEDRSIERIASTFRSDHDYASMLYDRLGEMSPLATDSESMGSELGAPAAMPLLPDMPTRSRRLLEDLGSAPIGLNEGSRGGAAGQSIKGKYGVSAQGLNLPFRTVM